MALMASFSGVRGIYGKDLTESIAAKYAYAYYSFLRSKARKKNPTVVIGIDTRPSGVKIADAIIGTLDCNIIDVGIAPTPAIEFAVRDFEADGGIIITASHNEPYWNGFKFLGNDGAILNEKEMNAVAAKYNNFEDFHKIQERKVLEKNKEALEGYTEFVLGVIGRENISRIKNSSQKIVLDPNGGAGAAAKRIVEECGAKAIGVNMAYGEFSRTIEPTEDSLFYLKSIADENNADFAAGFDCDADRIEILLRNGKLVSGNALLAIVVDEALANARNPKNQTVVVSDATSNIVRSIVQKFSAKIREVEAGEINVVEEMQKSKAIIGGEGSSGGVIIPPSKCRDGILTLLVILSIIAKRRENLENIVEGLPKYCTLKRKMEFKGESRNSIKKFIKDYYTKKKLEIRETGGVKGGLKAINGKNSFVWFRASRTEGNIFRIIADSNDKNEAEKLMDEAIKVFDRANEK